MAFFTPLPPGIRNALTKAPRRDCFYATDHTKGGESNAIISHTTVVNYIWQYDN